MQTKKWANEYRTTLVCVDRYDRRVPEGRFYNPHYPSGKPFCGVIDLVKQLDQMLDEMHFPTPYTKVRSFADVPIPKAMPPEEAERREGEVATLALRILFRQNASWQGSVTWLEGRREESFRSVLELMYLLDSAASGDVSPEEESKCRITSAV